MSLGGKYIINNITCAKINKNLFLGVFASCHSEDPINDILVEESRHRDNAERQGVITTDLINKPKNEDSVNSNQIVIRVTDTDSDAKGILIKFYK